ncbi:MAG TPA: GNAT family N-acetyltransferase [Sphingomicrobium sp.]
MDQARNIDVRTYSASRDALDALFSEADDSEREIASYRDLGEVLVALEGGEILGHVQVVETGEPGVVEIKSIAVLEARRSAGIGTALIKAALARCHGMDARLVRVATAAASTDALKFYQRQGFRIARVIPDFYGPERGYRPYLLNGIPLLDEVILELEL